MIIVVPTTRLCLRTYAVDVFVPAVLNVRPILLAGVLRAEVVRTEYARGPPRLAA